ncbi:MAG: Gfo/Idh/MocA family oxidoreductase [Bryobacterales bacterium]|nr:Gfo/Idh/MocA family oxidoreductase [Bryobacterales bacterium]
MQRRDFLKTSGLSASALASQSVRGANDKVQVGIIGLGMNGFGQHVRGLLALQNRAEIVAVSDIYAPRVDRTLSVTRAKAYHNYEDLLADKNVEAVIISTPDHWHAKMAIDAMRAGKDVDVEKPMALTIEEAREMVKVAKETGRILAVDSEHMANPLWQPARKAVESGVLGKLLWSQTSRSRNSVEPAWEYDIDPGAGPDNIDWQRWLGPSKHRVPFDKERYFRWRRFWDYGGGITTDLYFHHLSPLIHVTGRGFPVRVCAAGGHYVHPERIIEVPDTFLLTLDFENRHSIFVGGSLANSVELPIVVRGNEANLRFLGGSQVRPASFVIETEAPYADTFRARVEKAGIDGKWETIGAAPAAPRLSALPRPRQEETVAALLGENQIKSRWEEALRKTPRLQDDPDTRLAFFQKILDDRQRATSAREVFRVVAGEGESFHENFLRCVRARETPAFDGELGLRVQAAVNMGVEAYRKNKVVFLSPSEQRIVDRPMA